MLHRINLTHGDDNNDQMVKSLFFIAYFLLIMCSVITFGKRLILKNLSNISNII